MSRFSKAVNIAVLVAVVGTALFIMVNGLGLVDGLDFGAGAYFYADIPDFDRYLRKEAFDSRLSIPVAILLFLAWGVLMYRLWVRIEKGGRGKKKKGKA